MTWLLILLGFQEQSKTIFVDRVAIKVNDKIITERELINAYRHKRKAVLENFSGAELDQRLKEAWQQTLKEAEETLLLYEKAAELGLAFSDDDVKSRLMAIKESNGFSDKEFEDLVLQQTGMTFGEYVDQRKREDSAQAVVQSQIIGKIKIEDSEIAKYYDEHLQDFMTPETYRIAEILFLKDQHESAALARRIEDCRAFLNQGGGFAEAATQFSDSISRENGGDLGVVHFGDLISTIEDAVRELNEGQISEVLETPASFYIIKVLEKNPPQPKPIEEVRLEILEKLRTPRLETRIDTYLQDLKGQYLLQTHLKEMPWYLEL